MAKKLFDLSDSSVEILKNRDTSQFRHEYQYVEAAIQFYAKHFDRKDPLGILNEILENTKAIKRKVAGTSDEFKIDENEVPFHLAKFLE